MKAKSFGVILIGALILTFLFWGINLLLGIQNPDYSSLGWGLLSNLLVNIVLAILIRHAALDHLKTDPFYRNHLLYYWPLQYLGRSLYL